MVTGRERVSAAIANDVVDRPPISLWGHDYEAEWFIDRQIEVTCRSARENQWDWVKLQNRETCFAEDLGGHYRPDNSGETFPVTLAAIEDVAGWNRVIELAQSKEMGGAMQEQIDLARAVSEKLGPDVPIIQTVFSPLSVVGYLVGRDFEKAVWWLEKEPKLMGLVMEAIAGKLGDFAEKSIEAGAAGVFYAITGFASGALMGEEHYRSEVLATDHRVLEQTGNGWFNMLHLCRSPVYFAMGCELPFQAMSWGATDPANPSLEEARSLTTRARVGGMHRADPIRTGDPSQVFAAAKEVLGRENPRGLMFAPDCSVSPYPKPKPMNMLAFRASVEILDNGGEG